MKWMEDDMMWQNRTQSSAETVAQALNYSGSAQSKMGCVWNGMEWWTVSKQHHKILESVLYLLPLGIQGFRKLSPSVDFERDMGNEGLRVMGVFLRDIFPRASWMVLKGNLLLGVGCQQS